MKRFFLSLLIVGFMGFTAGLIIIAWVLNQYNNDLPDFNRLQSYRPALSSHIYAADGALLDSFGMERRTYVPINAIPTAVIQAFLAAEDKDYYSHPGIDPRSILRALWNNLHRGDEEGIQGGSTITQQVIKNLLLTPERTLERKIKEAILSLRVSQGLSKDRILELYLNEIYLGGGAYGVLEAARIYFNKPLENLEIHETAVLASLPKAPSQLNPRRNPEGAKGRRDYVIAKMADAGFITPEQATEAQSHPLILSLPQRESYNDYGYIVDEIRRQLTDNLGKDSLMKDGLTVISTIETTLQKQAEKSLRNGLFAYSKRRDYHGALGNVGDILNWQVLMDTIPIPAGAEPWQKAVILEAADEGFTVGIRSGAQYHIPKSDYSWAKHNLPQPGDVILIEPGADHQASLRQIPKIGGALIAMEPETGKIRALVGGFSHHQSQFNRAIQAMRQPGSTLKPFVYLAALEAGYTPASLIADEPVELAGGAPGEGEDNVWVPRNYSGDYYGITSLRTGVEKSMNVLTVQLGLSLGMPTILDVLDRFNLNPNNAKNLALVLGASETSVSNITAGYASFASNGLKISPTLVESVLDSHGRVKLQGAATYCTQCSGEAATKGFGPMITQNAVRLMEPLHARQMTSILEGVITRGTGRRARVLDQPVAGKTGTTNETRDAWFVGYNRNLVVGIYVGFDTPKSLGKKAQASNVALPIFIDFMEQEQARYPAAEFPLPADAEQVVIDKRTGMLPGQFTEKEDLITEIFRAGSAPIRSAEPGDYLPVINRPPTPYQPPGHYVPIITGTGGIY